MAADTLTAVKTHIEKAGSNSPSRVVEYGRKLAALAVGAIALTWLGAPTAADNSDDQSEADKPVRLPPSAAEPNESAMTTEQALAQYADNVKALQLAHFYATVEAFHQALMARWTVVHDCEQPGNWYAAGPTSDGYFEGGLGIMDQAWDNHHWQAGVAADSALQATPLEQAKVAEVIEDIHGSDAWGCYVPPEVPILAN